MLALGTRDFGEKKQTEGEMWVLSERETEPTPPSPRVNGEPEADSSDLSLPGPPPYTLVS